MLLCINLAYRIYLIVSQYLEFNEGDLDLSICPSRDIVPDNRMDSKILLKLGGLGFG